MKKPKNNPKNNKKKLLKIIILVVVAVAIAAIAMPIASNVQTRHAQVVRLEKASDDLYDLYTKLTLELKADATTASFKKVCNQASGKFNSGAITCGPRGEFKIDNSKSYESQKQIVEDVLGSKSQFTRKSIEDIRDYTTKIMNGFIISLVHSETNIVCYITVGKENDSLQYMFSCQETVPNFLPGYERE